MDIEFSLIPLTISDFDDKNPDLWRKSIILNSELKIVEDNSTFGTPLKISRKVFSSKDAKSFEVDLPNNMLEAKIAFSKSLI